MNPSMTMESTPDSTTSEIESDALHVDSQEPSPDESNETDGKLNSYIEEIESDALHVDSQEPSPDESNETDGKLNSYIEEIENLVEKLVLPLNDDAIRNIYAGLKENMNLLKEAIRFQLQTIPTEIEEPQRNDTNPTGEALYGNVSELTITQSLQLISVLRKELNVIRTCTKQLQNFDQIVRNNETLLAEINQLRSQRAVHEEEVSTLKISLEEATKDLNSVKARVRDIGMFKCYTYSLEAVDVQSKIETTMSMSTNASPNTLCIVQTKLAFTAKRESSPPGTVLAEMKTFYFSPLGHRFQCRFEYNSEHFTFKINVAKSALDNFLKWPLRVKLRVTLLNHVDKNANIVHDINATFGRVFNVMEETTFERSVIMGNYYFSDYLYNDKIVLYIDLID